MSVLDITALPIDPPETFPIAHLSKSSINLYQRCPEAWKRRYIDHAPDRSSGKMLLGSAAGAALAQHFGQQLETGAGYCTEELLDEFDAVWRERNELEDVDYGEESPGKLKDTAAAALRLYHVANAPALTPISVERGFELSWPGVPFDVVGDIDLETDDGRIIDYKMTGKTYAEAKVKASIEPDIYLAARRAEGDPASGFEWHLMVRTAQPKVPIIPAPRDERRLDLLTARIFSIARSIEWRWLNDCWQGAPEDLAWLCKGCAHASSCAWSLT